MGGGAAGLLDLWLGDGSGAGASPDAARADMARGDPERNVTMRKVLLLAAGLATMAMSPALSAEKYAFDPSHSQILFSYDHLGFSTTWGLFSGFEGVIMLDEADPSKSTVSTSFNAKDIITGWDARTAHFLSGDFFGADANPTVTFESTAVEVTGAETAKITGDLTMNGVTRPVVLDASLNRKAQHPMASKPWIGFDATTTIKRSDFDMGMFAPAVGDEVTVMISVEAMQADE